MHNMWIKLNWLPNLKGLARTPTLIQIKLNIINYLLTNKSDDKHAEEDPEDVAEDVHEDDGDEGDGEAGLALSLLALSSTEDLPGLPDAQEDLGVHVDQAKEGQNPGGEGGVPDQGKGVPGKRGHKNTCSSLLPRPL